MDIWGQSKNTQQYINTSYRIDRIFTLTPNIMNNREIVVASNNPGKLRELSQLFSAYQVKVLPQSRFSVSEVEETGASFVENALIKARHAAAATRRAVIADDSGIEVDVLNGEPGVYSARYAGEGASDSDNLQLLLKKIAAAGARKPAARFKCVMVYLRRNDDPEPIVAQGVWEGYIAAKPAGDSGFGYDPVFYSPTHACTAAELSPEVKNAVSHRGQALRKLVEMLNEVKVFG